jgi:hypothetical protein
MKIVGISGKAGSGKDTVAEILTDYGFIVIALADELKRFCVKVFGFSQEQLWGPSHLRNELDPRWGLSPRIALQTLGTWGRTLNEGLWTNHVFDVVTTLLTNPRLGYSQAEGLGIAAPSGPFKRPEPHGGIIVPDARFMNEMSLIKALGGNLVRVRRAGAGLLGDAGAHRSETEQDAVADERFDLVIDNNGTPADLRARVVSTFELFKA